MPQALDDRTTFNGILHYETFTVTRWIKDQPSTAAYWRNVAEKVYAHCQKMGDPVLMLSQLLEERHLATIPANCGVYGDLILATLRRVDWNEVAVEILATVDS